MDILRLTQLHKIHKNVRFQTPIDIKINTIPGVMEFSEKNSDRCMSELGASRSGCAISDDCWNLMSEPNTDRYTATHQLLFFALGSVVVS